MRGYAYAPVENMAAFTGTLIGRRYKPGQKYIQLVFKTAEGLRLSLTRDLQTVRLLNVGQKYYIEGPQYVHGQKTFIYEPKASPVQTKTGLVTRRKALVAGLVLIAIAGSAGAMALTRHGSANHTQNGGSGINKENQQASTETDASNANQATTTQDQQNTPSPTNAPTQSTTTRSSTKTSKTTSTPAQTASSNPSPEPSAPVNDTNQQVTDPQPVDSSPPTDPTPPPDPGPVDQSQ
jgi:hypothetical protein